jgi:very-short-patch-repair endonuclease
LQQTLQCSGCRPDGQLRREKQVPTWLKEDGIAYTREKAIGRCHMDVFIEPNICIEINGCYWHSCESCGADPNGLHRRQQVKDSRRYSFIRSKGFELHVFRECDINNDPDSVRDQIRCLAA